MGNRGCPADSGVRAGAAGLVMEVMVAVPAVALIIVTERGYGEGGQNMDARAVNAENMGSKGECDS